MSLFVVYVQKTGHVVGAVSATGASTPASAAALVGNALPMRVRLGGGSLVELLLPNGELLAHEADDNPEALVDPLRFGVELVPGSGTDDPPVPKSALPKLNEWSGGLAFDEVGLVVTLPTPIGDKAGVFALISGEDGTHLRIGDIQAGGSKTTLPLTVAEETSRGVLVLVTGWAGRLEEVGRP
jgi:hypothetical protein